MKDQMKGINRHNNELRLTLKASIRQALLELMKHHDFESIKINDLCEKAGVSRTGFYANYKTKRDVLEESLNDIIKDIEKMPALMMEIRATNFSTHAFLTT